ncbi:MAG: hypothetical protein U0R70_04840 [Solirubrobacteraceae bacterium]
MASEDDDARTFELDELLVRPGTYFNPQTEVLVVVDDSPELDREIFNMEKFEGAEWVLISDELAVDDARRDELLERFQVHYHPGGSGSVTDDGDEHDEDDLEADDQEVGRDD